MRHQHRQRGPSPPSHAIPLHRLSTCPWHPEPPQALRPLGGPTRCGVHDDLHRNPTTGEGRSGRRTRRDAARDGGLDGGGAPRPSPPFGAAARRSGGQNTATPGRPGAPDHPAAMRPRTGDPVRHTYAPARLTVMVPPATVGMWSPAGRRAEHRAWCGGARGGVVGVHALRPEPRCPLSSQDMTFRPSARDHQP